MIHVERAFEREDARGMGACPFHEPAALSSAERFFDFLSNAHQAFGVYSLLTSEFTSLCQPGNESDVVRAQFKLGGAGGCPRRSS